MWRKWLLACLFAMLALLFFCSAALADTPVATVPMQGKAAVITGQPGSQLRLKLESTDNTGFLLEIALNPEATGQNTASGDPVRDVNGSFTLGTLQQSITSGTAVGWLNSGGYGEISLWDRTNATSLDMSFTIGPDASVTSQVQGQWPAMPAPLPQPPQPTNHFFWYLSRTSAMAAYILLFINICLGLGLKTKYLDPVSARWRSFDLHQFTALLAIGLICLHIFSLMGDQYFSFSFKELLVPMASPYRATWTALGIIGFYGLLVIALSSYLRRFIGNKAWRVIHFASFGLFFVILYHGIKAGTDASTPWALWLYIVTGASAVFLFLWRFLLFRKTGAGQPQIKTSPEKI